MFMYLAQVTVDRIQSMIKSKGLVQKEVLKQSGVSENALKQMTDKKGMSSFSLGKIADILDCSVDYLLGRVETPSIVSDAFIGGDNNGIQAIKNESVSISNPTVNNCNDELVKEFSSVLSDLTVRERTELMTMIYRFVDEHKKV